MVPCSGLSAASRSAGLDRARNVTYSTSAEREAALKPLHGTIVAPDPDDDASAYVRVPSDGNEFALRAIADRLIRAPAVKEVGPVQCPPGP